MVRYPASAACHIFIFGPGTIAKDRLEHLPNVGLMGNSYMGTFSLYA